MLSAPYKQFSSNVFVRNIFHGDQKVKLFFLFPHSRSLALHNVHRVQSFLLRPCTGPLQPADWMFLPIVDLHNQAVSM